MLQGWPCQPAGQPFGQPLGQPLALAHFWPAFWPALANLLAKLFGYSFSLRLATPYPLFSFFFHSFAKVLAPLLGWHEVLCSDTAAKEVILIALDPG